MKILDILSEAHVSHSLMDAVKDLYRDFEELKEQMSQADGEQWDEWSDYLDYALDEGNEEHAEGWYSKLENMLDNYRISECEEVWVDENGEILSEGAKRAFKRVGKTIKRRFRCTTGLKKGKVVSDPKLCAQRKDPKKVRVGRKVARTRKGIRIRKSKISKRTSMSKMVTRMNKRLAGPASRKASKPSKPKSLG